MGNEKCNILIFGILSSGSSALVDLLSEYNNANLIPGEFDDFRACGLVSDQLNSHLSRDFPNNIDEHIKNISKKRLIYNICPIFRAEIQTITGIKSRLNSSWVRLRQLFLLEKLNEKLKSNIPIEDKIRFANDWITQIGNIRGKNKQFNVYNQPIQIGIDDTLWRAVFKPCKLICVYRDPKDQMADIVKRGFLSSSFGGSHMTIPGVNSESIYGRNREGAIKFHIDAIKKRMEWINLMKKNLDANQFLLIDFEGLVNSYDEYKSAIEDFIGGIKNNHVKKMKAFNPHVSKHNLGIYHDVLRKEELDLLAELNSWYTDMIKHNHVIKQERKDDVNIFQL